MTIENQQPEASNAQAEAEDNGGAEASLSDILSNAYDATEKMDTPEVVEEDAPIGDDTPPVDAPADNQPADIDPQEIVQPSADDIEASITPVSVAPDRFTDAAKAEWVNTSPVMQGEITRMMTELEGGIAQKNEQLKAFEGLEAYQKMAVEGGTTLVAAMQNYVGIENLLKKDPIAGLNQIASNIGLSLHQVAAHVLKQPVNQNAVQQNQQFQALQRENNALKEQVKNIEGRFEQQDNAKIQAEIDAFAAKHPHFETVREDMGLLINGGRASDMKSAYDLAVKMQGLQAEPLPPKTADIKQVRKAQTQKAKLSVSGSPSSGSDPDPKKRSTSIRGALETAMAATDPV